jgi:hypothetical protein
VLVRLLTTSPTDRMTEVALGILANLATHPGCAARILAEEGLVAVMLDRFLTSIHAPTLTEVCPCARSRNLQLVGRRGKLTPAWARRRPIPRRE